MPKSATGVKTLTLKQFKTTHTLQPIHRTGMGSTQDTLKRNTQSSSTMLKFKTLKCIKSSDDKEMLLKELDLAINWDTYLVENENIIDNFKALINAAEIYLKLLIVDNNDFKNQYQFIFKQRELIELMNIKLNYRIKHRITDCQKMSNLVQEKTKEALEKEITLKSLKNKKEIESSNIDKNLESIVHQDYSHKAKLEKFMQLINDENDNYIEFV